MRKTSVVVGIVLLVPGFVTSVSSIPPAKSRVLFDDFSYSNKQQLKKNGWIVRTAPGWPGIPGATWWDEGVTLLRDPDNTANRIVRMTSSTDGTSANTKHDPHP